jgi:hypothetical protein
MAQLAHTAVADIRQAIREKRPAIVVGPSRSGLTWLVNQNAALGVEPVVRLSLRTVRDVGQLRLVLQDALKLATTPERPGDLLFALAELDEGSRPRLVIINDSHRAPGDCITWLLQAALDSVTGVGQTMIPFVFEGAFDPDLALATALPDGYGAQPLIHYVEPSIPWRTLTEIDDLMRGRWRQSFTPGLVPWVADISGGDVALAQELLERLPNEGEIRDETLQAAVRYVVASGMRGREIRESVREINDADLMRMAASGQGIPGVVPSALEGCSLKKAYFAGLVTFDGIAGVYRVRGSITAQVIAHALGLDPATVVFEGRFILARLLIFFAHIAAFELDLRSLIRPRDPRALAAAVSTETGLGDYRNKVKAAVVKTCAPAAEALGRLNDALKALLPESMPVLDYVRSRLGSEPTDDSILDGVTFSQLTRIAREAKVISDRDEPGLVEINGYRNAFAHFRAETYGRCVQLLHAIGNARRVFEKAR